ncbi:MAG: acyl-CoA desaturase [Flavipsychrobacter sp.]|jgi:stearoyl-CoA desaturase (delta-9 desaturase)|nr:acyl-CoA desaturase [Flavipsychrobacter sp.]
MAVLLFFLGHHYFSLFFQTFFQHRYAAHAAFRMSKGWERFFYVITWIMQGSSYLSPRAYALMHRLHHAYADTDKDPHSPLFSKNLMDMMMKTWRYYAAVYDGSMPIEENYKKNVPDWKFMDKVGHSWASRIFWVGVYIWFYVTFATSPWMYLLIPIHMFMSPVHGAVINWYAHKYGYENFEMKNTSENLFPVDLLMLGEGYHNNHHKHASRANFGSRWHEIDPVYPFILLFDKLHIIRLNKSMPDAIMGVNRLERDAETFAAEKKDKDMVA